MVNEVKNIKNTKLIKVTKNALKNYDAVILITDHDQFNYKLIEKHAKIIIDTRNSFNNSLEKVYKA